MALVSHRHHRGTAATGQAALQTWRWNDRALPCPRCQSPHVGPWGTDPAQPGRPRSRCQERAGTPPARP